MSWTLRRRWRGAMRSSTTSTTPGWSRGSNKKRIALFRGHGRLAGERRVQVDDDVLSARRAVVVSTGSSAVIPPIEGLHEVPHWTNRQATTSRPFRTG